MHFTQKFDADDLIDLETAGLIEVSRPIHQPSGIMYDRDQWTVEVTQEGLDLVEANPELHPTPNQINAQDYVNSIEFPCFFYAGNGSPAGETFAILEETSLPVDLEDVEGEIEADGGFVCTNYDNGKGGWNHSDERGNTITKIQIYSDKVLWEREYAEWMGEAQ